MNDPLLKCPVCGSDKVGKSQDDSGVRCLSFGETRSMDEWAAAVLAVRS